MHRVGVYASPVRFLPPPVFLILTLAAVAVACGGGDGRPPFVPTADDEQDCSIANGCVTPDAGATIVLAAGDIAACDEEGDEVTAALLDELPGTLLVLGDIAYDNGSAREFEECYDPTWGRHYRRTNPVPGNHEYQSDGAAPYFAYFGEAAGNPEEGWYSLDLGAWHIVALNSNCDEIGGCGEGSPQEAWLRADLAANPARCTLAFSHYPRFSSGSENGSNEEMSALWAALDGADAEILLSGHEHNYERFAPQDADGAAADDGMVQFVAGTGGKSLYGFDDPEPNSEARNGEAFGVLQLNLRDDGYDYEFIAEPGAEFTDAGSGECG